MVGDCCTYHLGTSRRLDGKPYDGPALPAPSSDWLFAHGVSRPVSMWASDANITPQALRHRIWRGMSPEEAVAPSKMKRRKAG